MCLASNLDKGIGVDFESSMFYSWLDSKVWEAVLIYIKNSHYELSSICMFVLRISCSSGSVHVLVKQQHHKHLKPAWSLYIKSTLLLSMSRVINPRAPFWHL